MPFGFKSLLFCDCCSIYALPSRMAARLSWFFSSFLLLFCLHFFLASNHFVLPNVSSLIVYGCLLFLCLCLFWIQIEKSSFVSLLISYSNHSPKTTIYLPLSIYMSICFNSPFIHCSSPPSVLQDIRGGNRLLQPVLFNDLSGGAVLSQETGGLPFHHPHRRYWHVLCVCVHVCVLTVASLS